jgi:DNA polymerase elongation subunit (family B)
MAANDAQLQELAQHLCQLTFDEDEEVNDEENIVPMDVDGGENEDSNETEMAHKTSEQPLPPPTPVVNNPFGYPPDALQGVLNDVRRAPVTPVQPGTNIEFQHMFIDYVCAKPRRDIPPPYWAPDIEDPWSYEEVPVIRMVGITREGASILVRVHGFEPHFYSDIPPGQATDPESLEKLRIQLDAEAKAILHHDQDNLGTTRAEKRKKWDRRPRDETMGRNIEWPLVVRVECIERRPLRGYHKYKRPCLLITTRIPRHVPIVRKLLESGRNTKTYEADIPFDLRFTTDKGITGCDWVSVDLDPAITGASYSADRSAASAFQAGVRYHQSDPVHMCARTPGMTIRAELAMSWAESVAARAKDYIEETKQERRRARMDGVAGVPDGPVEVKVPPLCLLGPDYVDKPQRTSVEESRCQIEVDAWHGDIHSLGINGKYAAHAPLRIASFDIECAKKNFKGFPRAEEDPVVTICSRLTMTPGSGSGPRCNVEGDIGVALQLHGCTPVKTPGVRTVWFDSERDLLMAWRDLVVQHDPDEITGFNTPNFDFPYLLQRAEVLGIEKRFADFGRIRGELVTCAKKTFANKGSGTIENNEVKIVGRLLYDVRQIAQRTIKLSTYSLNAVAGLIGQQKIDMDHHELPKLFFQGTDTDRERIATYCDIDSALPLAIARKRLFFVNAVEMARATRVPLAYELSRGQQIRVLALLLNTARDRGRIIDSAASRDIVLTAADSADKYEGAIVLTPATGFHDEPIVTLDFASLYPSIMLAYNMCYSTIIEEEQKGEFHPDNLVTSPIGVTFLRGPKQFKRDDAIAAGVSADNLETNPNETVSLIGGRPIPKTAADKLGLKEGPDYRRVTATAMSDGQKQDAYMQMDTTTIQAVATDAEKHVIDAVSQEMLITDTEKRHGLLPTILMGLLARRAIAKKQLAAESDPTLRAVFDGRQLALKIVANSTYGFTGTARGKAPERRIAGSVTGWGRDLIEFTRDFVEKHFSIANGYPADSKVIYGDSVTGDTPLIIRKNGAISVIRIDDINGEWRDYGDGKEAITLADGELEVWNDGSFTNVNRVIRHQCTKPIYRVLTHTGVVDCTSDHSLIRNNGTATKPTEVAVGDTLLHTDDSSLIPLLQGVSTITDVNEAFAMGMFASEGSCGVYGHGSSIKYTWAVNNADMALLEKVKSKLPFPSKILNTLASSGVYKLVPVGNIKAPTLRYRELFYNSHKEKRIPTEILCASLEVVRAFWDGFYGDVAPQLYQTGKQVTEGLWLLARRIGYAVSINDRQDKPTTFRLNMTNGTLRYPADAIKKIWHRTDLPTAQQVYDLETASHHFHVGPGNLVVHNTDSVMVRFRPDIPIGEEAARIASATAINKLVEMATQGSAASEVTPAACIAGFADIWECQCTRNKKAVPMVDEEKKKMEAVIRQTAGKILEEHINCKYHDTVPWTRRTNSKHHSPTEITQEAEDCAQECLDSIFAGVKHLMPEVLKLRDAIMQSAFDAIDMVVVERAAVYGKEACKLVTAQLPRPLTIDFEKVMRRFLLGAKKRYAGVKCLEVKGKMVDPHAVATMGLETSRRDGCPLQREVLTRVLNDILIKHNPRQAILTARKYIAGIDTMDYPLDKYVITKALSKKKNSFTTKQAHTMLADRLSDHGDARYALGDRVRMVIAGKDKKAKTYEKGEDPLYAAQQNIQLDTQYYAEKQLTKPLRRIFKCLVPGKDVDAVLNPSVDIEDALVGREKFMAINDRTSKAVSHAMASTAPGKIGSFLVCTGMRCLGCSIQYIPLQIGPLRNGEERIAPGLCYSCHKKESRQAAAADAQLDIAAIRERAVQQATEMDRRVSEVSRHCSSCLRQRLGKEVADASSCLSSECPMTYANIKAATDAKAAHTLLRRLDLILDYSEEPLPPPPPHPAEPIPFVPWLAKKKKVPRKKVVAPKSGFFDKRPVPHRNTKI